ncbi:MAG: hypothetical protein AAFX90_10045 [Pseudomonadota bacterium]
MTKFVEAKSPSQSMTIQGAVIALIGAFISMLPALGSLIGVEVSPSDASELQGHMDQLINAAGSVITVIGGIRAWIGRLRATTTIQ